MISFFPQGALTPRRSHAKSPVITQRLGVILLGFMLSLSGVLGLSNLAHAQNTDNNTSKEASPEVFEFDHFKTGFALEGMHAVIDCESCHTRGQFEGTPVTCVSCHSEGSPVNASAKPQNHIQVLDQCQDCHTPHEWTFVNRVDHISVLGSCTSCHNGFLTGGKSVDHIVVSNNCDSCHLTSAWAPVPASNVDHSEVIGTCVSCHNGVVAGGKNANHILVSNNCENCHQTSAWAPVPSSKVDHAEVIGTCASCHNGVVAGGKSSNHISPVSNNCDACHSTAMWAPTLRVDHTEIPTAEAQICAYCHNGKIAVGQHPGHIPTGDAECSQCHKPNRNWMFEQ